MVSPAEFFLQQAAAHEQIQFLYSLAERRIVYVNEAYERVLNGHRERVNEELPGLLSCLPPEELPVWHHYWKLWQVGRLREEVDLCLRLPGEPDRWFSLLPHWEQDPQGRTWLGGTLREVSEQKRHAESSQKFSLKKNTVLEILSHDLASGFVMVDKIAGVLHQRLDPDTDPELRQLLPVMQQTSRQNLQLIRNLVDEEFLESSEIPLKRELVDVRERVAQTLEPFQRFPENKARHVVYEAPSEPLWAEIDVNKVMQVVHNLVSNALKFTPDEKPVTVRVALREQRLRVSIADEGVGIPAHLLPDVFKRFTPARREGLRGEPTTGLGLSLCKRIVELHGGTLTVRSTEGQGSTFTFELPLLATSHL
jgi:two-component system sensor histidine kinase VicK